MSIQSTAQPSATQLIKIVHVQKRNMALEDDIYRAVLERAAGIKTCAGATIEQLQAVIDEMQRMQPRHRGPSRPQRVRSQPSDKQVAQYNRLRALWISLYALDVVRDRTDDALASWIKRQTGIDAVRWAAATDLSRAIDALRAWAERVGYLAERDRRGSYQPALIRAQWRKLAPLTGDDDFAAFLRAQGCASTDPAMIGERQQAAIVTALHGLLVSVRQEAENHD